MQRVRHHLKQLIFCIAESVGTRRGAEISVGIGTALGIDIGVVMDDFPVGIATGFVLRAAVGRE